MVHFFIDESGSFVSANFIGAWNVTAALAASNPELRSIAEALRRLKVRAGVPVAEECKLGSVNEKNYLRFLDELSATECTLYCVATDSGLQNTPETERHRDIQAAKITEHEDKMIYPAAVEGLHDLADQVRALSPQLYLQLICQVELIAEVIEKSILFYVQRVPKQLNGFRWRIDEKAPGTNNFEETFRTLVPPLLQAKSLRKPGIQVVDFDYSAMRDYFYTKEDGPTYLKDTYGIDARVEGSLNAGKIVWEDFEFVDSRDSVGVQVVDLLASGLRKCLRGQFQRNEAIAEHLGRLMIQTIDQGFPLKLVALAGNSNPDNVAAAVSRILRANQRNMML